MEERIVSVRRKGFSADHAGAERYSAPPRIRSVAIAFSRKYEGQRNQSGAARVRSAPVGLSLATSFPLDQLCRVGEADLLCPFGTELAIDEIERFGHSRTPRGGAVG